MKDQYFMHKKIRSNHYQSAAMVAHSSYETIMSARFLAEVLLHVSFGYSILLLSAGTCVTEVSVGLSSGTHKMCPAILNLCSAVMSLSLLYLAL